MHGQAREPRQGRKAATVTTFFPVPWSAWPLLNPKSEMGIGYLPQPAGQLIVRLPKAMHF